MKRLAWACLALLVPLSAHAQWSVLPNGAAGYTFFFITSGIFVCDPHHAGVTGGTCTSNGNQMTLTSGTSALDFVFHNVVTDLTATQKAQQAPIGQLDITFSGGGPFFFPVAANGTQPLFGLQMWLDVNGVTKVATTGYISTGTSKLVHNCCSDFVAVLNYGLPPSPPPFQLNELDFYNFTQPDFLPEDASIDIEATVRLTPEPTSILLMATGLMGIAGVTRRKKRQFVIPSR